MRSHEKSSNVAPVIVGVDGSLAALAAVDVAVREAALRGRPLRLIHAFAWPYPQSSPDPTTPGPAMDELRGLAERVLAVAWGRAHAACPELSVDGEIVTGGATAVLRDCSRTAPLVVLGDRGLGGFSGLLVGSVAVQLVAHAACPVLVARGTADPAAPVLLGVDG